MTTRADRMEERSLAEIGIGVGRGTETRGRGDAETVPISFRVSRAERIFYLMAVQVRAQQELLDEGFAVSTTLSYNLGVLATEFSVPVPELLRAFRKVQLTAGLPGTAQVTSDHRIVITLVPTQRG